MQLSVYLSFAGTAAEALELYAQAFGGSVSEVHYYRENPEVSKELPSEWADKIMHASFNAPEFMLMASDVLVGEQGPCGVKSLTPEGSPVTLSLNFSSKEQLVSVFNTLAVGGTVTMPLADTFWGAHFGMLTDRFGIKWMFNYDYPRG
jgi:PhnB protein